MQKDSTNELYTSKETRDLLNVSSSTLKVLVEKGVIEKVTPPGKTHGYYTRASVDEYHRQQTHFKETYALKSDIEFREATVADIDQEAELASLVFGERAAAREQRKAFVRANPHVNYHLYDQGKLVAYIDLIPLKHRAIMDWVEGRLVVWDIDPESIESFEPGKPVECLIADMITSPTISLVKRTYYGRRLLAGLLRKLVEMGKQGIQITKIYAGSSPKTPQGLHVISEAGFQEIHRRGEGKVMFALDVMNSDEKILHAYQEAIKQWKRQYASPSREQE